MTIVIGVLMIAVGSVLAHYAWRNALPMPWVPYLTISMTGTLLALGGLFIVIYPILLEAPEPPILTDEQIEHIMEGDVTILIPQRYPDLDPGTYIRRCTYELITHDLIK